MLNAWRRIGIEDILLPSIEAGLTWWVEGMWVASEEATLARIQQGLPGAVL